MRKSLVVLVVAAISTGCGEGDGSGGGSDTRAPGDLRPVLGALCDFTDRCEELPPIASRDRGECIDILYFILTCRFVEEHDDWVGVERVDIGMTAEELATCEDFLNGIECEDFACVSDGTCPESEACFALFAAYDDNDDDDGDILRQGDECNTWDDQCGGGFFCLAEHYDEELEVAVCAACVPLLEVGEACSTHTGTDQCAQDLACAQDMDTGTFSCEPLREDGAECYEASVCASGFCGDGVCSSSGFVGDPCEVRNACRWDQGLTCIDGSCEPARENGEPCSQDDHCQVFQCEEIEGLCGLPDGGSCFDSHDCRSGFCEDRDCLQPRGDGETCSIEAPEGCTSGYCDPSTLLCAQAPPPSPEGAPCVQASECEDGLSCDVVCYRPCDDHSDCPGGQFCGYANRMMCMDLGEDGAGCDDDDECLSEYCNDNDQCATRPGIGDPCFGYGDCYPYGYCSGGMCVERGGPGDACEGYDSCLHPYICQDGRCRLISLACEPASAGEQCTFLRFCDEESYCDTSFECVRRLGEDDACMGLENECRSGLFCDLTNPTGPVCRAGAVLGEACGPEMICADGSVCLDSVCSADEGEYCTWHEDCPAGTFCNDDRERCEPYRGVGEECDTYDILCREGLFCNEDEYPHVCAEPHGVGEECDHDVPCRAELYCNDDDYPYTCAARPGLGEWCDDDTGCEPGATCTSSYDGTCDARASEGEDCETNHWDPYGSNCAEDLRCEYGDSGYECMALREAGESCDSNDDCVEGLICEWSESGDICQGLRDNGESCDSDGDCVSGICNGRINRCVAEPDCVRL